MSKLELKNVNKIFGQTHVIKDVSMVIEEGEFVVFVGPSGCGKSTLLRLISGLEDISDGELIFDGDNVTGWTPSERGIGMVFQSYALYPHMTVEQNIAFGLQQNKVNDEVIKQRVEAVSKSLELSNLMSRKPKELSGGQRQRVAIGRAIAKEPRVFLFDEPLSNLDAKLRVQMRMEISSLHERLRSTMVYVTHDQVEAMTLADKIVVLNEGQVSQIGTPMELYHRPKNQFVAGFIGSPQMNFIPVSLLEKDSGFTDIEFGNHQQLRVPFDSSSSETDAKFVLGIRPEHLTIVTSEDKGLFEATVEVVEELGNETLLYLSSPVSKEPIVVRALESCIADKQSKVYLAADESDFHLFHNEQALDAVESTLIALQA